MSQENLRKMAHPFLALYNVDLISIRKCGNEQTDRHTRNLELFGTNVKHSRNNSRKFEKNSSSRTGDIQYYPNLSKQVRQWRTDRQTRSMKLFGSNVKTSLDYL